MKKFLSFLIILSTILSVLTVQGFAARGEYLVSETFENYPLGSITAAGAKTSGTANVKRSADGSNRAVELSSSVTESSLGYAFDEVKGDLSFAVDLEYKTGWSYTEFYISDPNGKSFTLAYINENGQLFTSDKHIVTGIARNRPVNVCLTYNCKQKKLSVYIDGKIFMSKRSMGDKAFDVVSLFGIKVSGTEQYSCMADNFTVYKGNKVLFKGVPGYTPTEYVSSEYVSSDAQETVEEFINDTVYVNRVFGEEGVPEFDKLSITPALNKIEIEQSIFDSNKYIKLEKTQPSESHVGFAGTNTERYHVIECSFSTESNTPSGRLLFMRDGNAESMFETFLSVKTNGDVQTNYGDVVCKIEPMVWTDIGIVVDIVNLVFDVYVNKELKLENIPFKNKTITAIPLIRTGCDNSSSQGTLLIDNIRSYGGKALREIEVQKYGPITEQDDIPIKHLGNKKAVHPYAGTMFISGNKTDSKHPFLSNDEYATVYAHSDDLKTLFGENVKLTSSFKDDANYYNLVETAKASGYLHQAMDTRLLIFDKKQPSLNETQLMSIQRYMYYVRPSSTELIELFETHNKNEHPRVLLNKEKLDEIKATWKLDKYMNEWGNNVIKNASYWIGRDVANYQELLDNADPAITNLAMAYHLTGDERYAIRAWKFIQTICDLEDWNPDHYLTTGEFSYIVGLGYDWLYHVFTDEQKKYIEENLLEKGVGLTHMLYFNQLTEGEDGYLGWWQAESNWNAVCNGATMCAAIAIFDVYPQICSELIENASKGLEGMLNLYYPHGTYEEGLSYWNYAMTYLTHAILSFRCAFGTDFGIADVPGFDKTGWYIINLTGSTTVMTMGDVDSKLLNNPHIMFTAVNFKDYELMAARFNEMEKLGYEGGVFEMIYYDPAMVNDNINLSLDSYMKGAEVISLREEWYNKAAVYLGASGGCNYRAHGHMDIGSYVVDMSGERFIVDIGAENYSAKGGYFTRNRYLFYRARPEGHNLYIINPVDSVDYYGMDKEAVATAELIESKPKGAIAVMDLSDAYAGYATSAKRGYMLTDDRRAVVVRDEIDLAMPDSTVHWFIHTKAEIESINGNSAVLHKNGKKMLVTVSTNGTNAVFQEVEPATLGTATKDIVADSNNSQSGVRKLALIVNGTGRLNITVKYKLLDDEMIISEPPAGDISTWVIPDGEVTELPCVDAIYVNGELVENFNPEICGYTKLVASGEENIPVVTATSGHRVEVTQAPAFGEDAIVRVYNNDNANVYRTYRIYIYKLKPLEDVDGMRRYPVAEITASAIPQVENGPENVIDQDINTRWAAEGAEGQWIMLELDDTYPIEKIGVSWMNGTARSTKYKLEISVDGKNWTEIYNGASSGTTNDPEYTFTGGKMAKYIRCTGYGNTVNNWNSLTEFVVLGNQR